MTDPKPDSATRTEGLVDVAADAIVHGARVVHAAHQGIVRRNFWLVKQVPGIRAPAEVVEAVHEAHLGVVYGAIRGGARALQVVANAALGRSSEETGSCAQRGQASSVACSEAAKGGNIG